MVGERLTTSSLVVVFLSCSLAPPLRAAEPGASSAQSPVKEAWEKSAEEMDTDAAKPHWSDIRVLPAGVQNVSGGPVAGDGG